MNERTTALSARPALHAVFATGGRFAGVSFSEKESLAITENSVVRPCIDETAKTDAAAVLADPDFPVRCLPASAEARRR